MFKYDHRQVDLMTLRNAGIRTFREVEEMIEGYSVEASIPDPGNFCEYIGFTRESRPLEVTIKITNDDFEIVRVERPSVEDVVDKFCRYYRSINHFSN